MEERKPKGDRLFPNYKWSLLSGRNHRSLWVNRSFTFPSMSLSLCLFSASILTYYCFNYLYFILQWTSRIDYVHEKLGYRLAISFSQICTIIGSVIACLIVQFNSVHLLGISRFILGLPIGLLNCIVPLFLWDITSHPIRNYLSVIHQFSVILGIGISSFTALEIAIGRRNIWPFVLTIQIIPGIITLFGILFVYDSPKFLFIRKNWEKEAQASLKFYKGNDIDFDNELYYLNIEKMKICFETTTGAKKSSFRYLFTDKSVRKQLIIVIGLYLTQQFTGINSILFYSSSLFKGT
ncbi:DgyrCDS10190 [Dimorphilus gyrociliatus]|uniref:DgyrCDS10190 n=1 Tax=Dimorphilus gyrociliatus TaxID=2664684 RepID=A0A7I8W0M3_9ANNE|nr:DgyrCDS10190 [Dimorphilus gyrociliatus]